MTPTSIGNWKSLKKGDSVILSDEATLIECQEDKIPNALEGLNHTVDNVIVLEHNTSDVTQLLIKVNSEGTDGDRKYIFVTSIENGEDSILDAYLFVIPEWFVPSNRIDLLEAEHYFLFAQPEDPDNFVAGELELTKQFEMDINGEEESYQVVVPAQYYTDSENDFVTIVEYASGNSEMRNPNALIIEWGGIDKESEENDLLPEGGLVQFFEGRPVPAKDIDLFIK
jgi:hypothetical protein